METVQASAAGSFFATLLILLLLSLITEKLTSLFRRSFSKGSWLTRRTLPYAHLSGIEAGNNDKKKKMERDVLLLSFFIGTVLTTAIKADLIAMLTSLDPRQTLFWATDPYADRATGMEVFGTVLGLLLSGLVLSFGARIFHDLQDTLYEMKALRKKQAEGKSYQLTNNQQMDSFFHEALRQIAHAAIRQRAQELRQLPNVIGVHEEVREENGKLTTCAVVQLADNDTGKIPVELSQRMSAGTRFDIPIRLETNIDRPKANGGPGNAIAESNRVNYEGTLGCILQDPFDGAKYALTCSHVALAGDSRNWLGRTPDPRMDVVNLTVPGGSDVYGPVSMAIRNAELDIALVGPLSGENANQLPDGLALSNVREVTADDINKATKVTMRGKNATQSGQIIMRNSGPVKIDYDRGESPKELSNLFVVARKNKDTGKFQAISQGGDSGAAVYDEQGNVLGIVVAGSSQYTYVMPMISIIRQLDMTLA